MRFEEYKREGPAPLLTTADSLAYAGSSGDGAGPLGLGAGAGPMGGLAVSGVKGWVLHDLRRTVATGMAALGVAPHVATPRDAGLT